MLKDRQNFVAQSYSGSGKQIAMAVLMLSHVKKNVAHPHILAVMHTLEAAIQLKRVVLAMMDRQEIYTVHSAVAGEQS